MLAASTVPGIAAGFFLVVVAYAATVLGLAAVSLPLGRAVARRAGLLRQSPLVDLLAGLLVVFILSLIPFLGPLVVAVLAILGFGAIRKPAPGATRAGVSDRPEHCTNQMSGPVQASRPAGCGGG